MIFKEGIPFWRRNKMEMEEEDNTWRRKMYFFSAEQNRERKMRNIFEDK